MSDTIRQLQKSKKALGHAVIRKDSPKPQWQSGPVPVNPKVKGPPKIGYAGDFFQSGSHGGGGG
jgi:hypothetical protein